MNRNTAGIILAGGQSRRMGTDKALLKIGEQRVIERVISALQNCTSQICLAAAKDKEYDFLNLNNALDLFPGQGPLSGLYAGMNSLDAEWYALSACDLPFASATLMQYLLDFAYPYTPASRQIPLVQAVIPTYQDRYHPLYAVYHRSVKSSLYEALQNGQLKVMDWLNQHNTAEIPLEGLLKQDHLTKTGDLTPWCLHNMNDPEAYQQALHMYNSRPNPKE